MGLCWDFKIDYGILERESAMGFMGAGYLEPSMLNGIWGVNTT